MFKPPSREQVIALAGVFQACNQVDSYARLGTGNAQDMETAISSLLNQNPESTEAVYGNLAKLENGFASIEHILGNMKDPANAMILRYVIGVFHIGQKLSGKKYRNMMQRIGDGIGKAASQAEIFSTTHANVTANIADLYQQTISTLNFRIQVNGVASHLQQQAIANKIRCLLFSAVRSAILCRQMGGDRFQMILRRNQLLSLARELHREARRTVH